MSPLITPLMVLTVVIFFTILAIAILIILFYTKVPFVRTPKHVAEKIITKANIKPNDKVYDLGCGDARLLINIEKRTGAQTIGYEISPWAYILAQLNIFRQKAKTRVLYKNFYHADLSDADVVFCFLMDTVMPKVGKQLEKQLKAGTRVISYAFAIKDWQPMEVIATRPNDPKSSKIYIYQR